MTLSVVMLAFLKIANRIGTMNALKEHLKYMTIKTSKYGIK